MAGRPCVIFCRCGGKVIPKEKENELASGLKNLDADIFEVTDFCAFSLNEKDFLNTVGGKYPEKIIIACYPRAVKNLLIQGGIRFENPEVFNFKELSSYTILSKLREDYKLSDGEARYEARQTSLEVPAWFPVVEQSRCTFCGKCARFCLFGVYRFGKKHLEVANPLACKNNCPACGRNCPTSAIMFPRLAEKSVLAGAEPEGEANAAKQDNLFLLLNERNQNRKDIFRFGVISQAEEERRKALEEIKRTTNTRQNDLEDS